MKKEPSLFAPPCHLLFCFSLSLGGASEEGHVARSRSRQEGKQRARENARSEKEKERENAPIEHSPIDSAKEETISLFPFLTSPPRPARRTLGSSRDVVMRMRTAREREKERSVRTRGEKERERCFPRLATTTSDVRCFPPLPFRQPKLLTLPSRKKNDSSFFRTSVLSLLHPPEPPLVSDQGRTQETALASRACSRSETGLKKSREGNRANNPSSSSRVLVAQFARRSLSLSQLNSQPPSRSSKKLSPPAQPKPKPKTKWQSPEAPPYAARPPSPPSPRPTPSPRPSSSFFLLPGERPPRACLPRRASPPSAPGWPSSLPGWRCSTRSRGWWVNL